MSVRFMMVSFICVTLFIGSAAAAAKPVSTTASASDLFASAVTAAAERGWRLADMIVVDEQELHIVMAARSSARRYSLYFDRQTERASHYISAKAKVPLQYRYYTQERSILALLGVAGATSFSSTCGELIFKRGNLEVYLDANQYFVAHAGVYGKTAQLELTRQITKALRHGHVVSSVVTSKTIPPGAVRALNITLASAKNLILHVGLDKGGRVMFVQRREAPGLAIRTPSKQQSIVTQKVAGRVIDSVGMAVKPTALGQLRLGTARGRQFFVPVTPIDTSHGGCGC